jgi:MFS family permease
VLAGSAIALSALLQTAAAAQRWALEVRDPGPQRTIEDHLFDYVIPVEPWVSIGSAALLFGVGYLLIAVGIVCLGLGCRAVRGAGSAPVIAAVVSGAPVAVFGLHAAVSGMTGAPSALALLMPVGFTFLGGVQIAGLVVMATMAASRSRGWAVGLIVLTATSVFGYVLAGFHIAPLLAGYQSYDTTPWTEGVVAAFTLVAATAILIGSLRTRRDATVSSDRATPSAEGATRA